MQQSSLWKEWKVLPAHLRSGSAACRRLHLLYHVGRTINNLSFCLCCWRPSVRFWSCLTIITIRWEAELERSGRETYHLQEEDTYIPVGTPFFRNILVKLLLVKSFMWKTVSSSRVTVISTSATRFPLRLTACPLLGRRACACEYRRGRDSSRPWG